MSGVTPSPTTQPKLTAAERRAARGAEMRRLAERRRRRNTLLAGVAVVVVVVAAVLFLRRQMALTAGVQTFEDVKQGHVQGAVNYPQTPPAGGEHASAWQNCGYYDAPIGKENGVHSLEHGAVWITYRPDLPAAQIERLRSTVRGQTYILVSPFPDLPAPVVASAWGKQVRLDGADDARLGQFLSDYRDGPQAPEPGASCTGAIGVPK